MKLIKDLTIEELKTVYYRNDKLQHEVLDHYIESEMFWVTEMLGYITHYLSSYSIGFCNRNQHLKVNSNRFVDFLYGLQKLQKDMNFLPEAEAHIIEDALNDDDIDQYDFSQKILEQFDTFTQFPSFESLENYYIDVYLDSLDDTFYVDDDYILHEQVSYVKDYN